MLKSYSADISAIRWLTSPRDDVSPVLQYGLRPIHGGALDWFDVPTEVAASPAPTASKGTEAMCACGDRPASQCDEEWGPNCDLGNNAAHARRAPAGSSEAVDAALGINRAAPSEPEAQKAVAPKPLREALRVARTLCEDFNVCLERYSELERVIKAMPAPAASMEVQGLTELSNALQRALAAKNGWRLGEGQ